MPRYSDEFKERIVQKMMPPNFQSIAHISRETQRLCADAVYLEAQVSERRKSRASRSSNPENWSGQLAFLALIKGRNSGSGHKV